ncbi:hypothetical protein POM88_030715 [Heracleum sosnowskyi]|uniref:F-box domain-containing protein n=1 Tax=Heracleum sosnowskyi TaxID=360622 RepID=A0AAD8MIU8_9APIA|nr:hypothetical protein POM88_030715 [Heracleum sosnowskyi]
MASDAKKRLVDRGTAVDRISNLPGNVTDHILERLPLHDAARTSILSKTWTGLWGMHPNLVFDEAFFSQLVSKMNNQVRDGKVKSKDGLDLVGSSEHMVSSVVQYLQSPTLVEMIFDQLQTVKIHKMVGSRAELQFIKLLLASTPLLRWIKLLNTTIDDPKEESRILKELMSFPRASKDAQIIWS